MPDPRIDGLRSFELIGRGGSSDVYRAQDDELDRTVAVKVLRFDGAQADVSRLFLRERKAAESLPPHPHLAEVLRSGISEDGVPYVVMAEATGGSLADRLQDAPLAVDEVVELASGLVEGLRAAHAGGVLHRDIKPSNVLIDAQGRAQLADFGIASVVGASITTTGSNPYTLAYAPPEVLRGQAADERSDVYALGATLFEMLDGRPPFAALGLTPAEIMGRALHAPAPPLARDDVDAALRDLVGSMLDVDPARRPSLDEVSQVLRGEAATARRARSAPRTGRVLTAVAAIVVVVGGFALFRVVSDEGEAASNTASSTTGSTTTAVANEDRAADPAATWIENSDESASVAAASEPIRTAARALVGDERTESQVPVGVYFNPAFDFPAIPSIPNVSFWRFAAKASTEPGCREYFPPAITMTGYAADLAQSSGVTTLVGSMAFSTENGAGQMFRGRTIGMGVRGEDCVVDGANVEIDQHDAPLAGVPEWADELTSWRLEQSMLSPGDRAGYAYIVRVGRRIWELRVTEAGDHQVTETELTALIDAIGRSAAIPLQPGVPSVLSTSPPPVFPTTTTSSPTATAPG